MAIDIGDTAIDRIDAYVSGGYTVINKGNPANASGIIDTVKIYAVSGFDLLNCKVGIFYTTNGLTFKCRSAATIGNVTSGSQQTFPGLSLAVVILDYIGLYYTDGKIEAEHPGGHDVWWIDDDYCNVDAEGIYTLDPDIMISLYGTGVEGWVGKIMGGTNPAKVMGVARANISKVKGVT